MSRVYLSDIVLEEKPEFGNLNLIVAKTASGKSTLPKILLEKGILKDETLIVNDFDTDDDKTKSVGKYTSITYDELKSNLEDNKDYLDNYSNIFYDGVMNSVKHKDVALTKNIFSLDETKRVFYLDQSAKEFFVDLESLEGLTIDSKDIKLHDYSNM